MSRVFLLLAALSSGCASARAAAGDPHAEAAACLERLVLARGVSGHERPVADAVRAILREQGERAAPVEDEQGNLILRLGRGERTLVFVAHMDEVGLEVTAIRADGLLETRQRGGIYEHLYQDTVMELVTERGVLPAIAIPPGEPAEPGARRGPILLDVGAHGAEEAGTLGVHAGDPATVRKELLRLGPHRASGRSLDDRVGCAALLLALRRLDPARLDRTVVFAWVVREEVGLEGADALARALRPAPETVFAVDTFVTSDSPRDDPRFAFAPLGAGPVLRALDNSSLTPRPALDRVRAIAGVRHIPLQTGTMGGGNDGSRFVPEGALDCPLAWPQRCSHSRVETMDLRDLERLAELLAAVAEEY
jgi:putative aminopeptidase FrvX